MMASPENGTEASSEFDIEALINSEVDEEDVSALVTSLHKELYSSEEPAITETAAANVKQESKDDDEHDSKEKAVVKTVGQTSSATTTASLTLNLSGDTAPPTQPDRTFGGLVPPTPGTPSAQLLTNEEQSQLYKQASLLAIHALFSKNGQPKAKEILNKVTKVKNFLTNLIQLAGNTSNELKVTVHSLVQKLVAGTITEEEFAGRIEVDLQSRHQPSLLPFLKNAVPDLRSHLQLQKDFMKQLIQKKVIEKTQGHVIKQEPSSTAPPSLPTATTTEPRVIDLTKSITTTTPMTPRTTQTVSPALLLSPQQQQLLKLQLAKLPEDQRHAQLERLKNQILLEKQKKLQLLQQQQQQQQKKKPVGIANLTPAQLANLTPAQQQQLTILLKQQQLIREQQLQQQTTPTSAKGVTSNSSSPPVKGLSSLLTNKTKKTTDQVNSKPRTVEEEHEEEYSMDIAGVNIEEESAKFLPKVGAESKSCKDSRFIDSVKLRESIRPIALQYGISDISEEALALISHATEERLKNITEKITIAGRHRTTNLKDEDKMEACSDVRGQLKVLDRIDEISAGRKQAKKEEDILKRAKSRKHDPDVAKVKEQAKQLMLAHEKEIHQRAANDTALAAIGRRKRTANVAFGESSGASQDGESIGLNMFGSLNTSRTKQKRKILIKDVMFVMEQERETRHSHILYKSYLKY